MTYLESLKKYDDWLIYSGFKAGKFPPLNSIYYRDDTKNPDQITGANFVIFDPLDGVTSFEQLKARSNELFQQCLKFFKKGMGSFKLAKSFCAFFIFPVSKFDPIFNENVVKSRPLSNDFTGTYFPILIDFSSNNLYFYKPSNSQILSNTNKVADQIEFLFLPPLLPPLELPDYLLTLINVLRKSAEKASVSYLFHQKNKKIDEIKQITKQLYYEGSKTAEIDSAKNLLYALYLTEFLQILENRKDRDFIIRSEGLNFFSFSSLDQFVTDSVDSLGRTAISGFQKGFDQTMKSSATKELWTKLKKNDSISAYAYCGNCHQVLELTKNGSCPKSSFHKVETASYFEVNEHEAIQIFCERGSN